MSEIEDLNCGIIIKVIAAGKTFANVSTSLNEPATFILNRPPDRIPPLEILDVTDKVSRAEILKFISNADWLFVITDVESSLAEKVAECIEEFRSLPTTPSFSIPYFSMPWEVKESGEMVNRGELLQRESKCPLVTSIILCPSADDERLKDINFGTQIILPEDKIAEIGLTNDEAIYQVIDKITCILSLRCLIGLDFVDVVSTLGNAGRAYVGLGKSLGTLQATKKALESPLLIEEISKAKNILFVFVGNSESLNMLEANEASFYPEGSEAILQVAVDDTADGVTAFILATNF